MEDFAETESIGSNLRFLGAAACGVGFCLLVSPQQAEKKKKIETNDSTKRKGVDSVVVLVVY